MDLSTLLPSIAPYPRSIVDDHGRTYFLGADSAGKALFILSEEGDARFHGRANDVTIEGARNVLQRCEMTHDAAAALREQFEWLRPVPLGLRASVGCGDRLGLATPGHVRSVRKHSLAPIFPQQSIREMERTRRTAEDVLDDAMWGVFEEGWREGFGADADHLKTFSDVDRTVAAGFTFFTIDPSAYADDDADTDEAAVLRQKVGALPWEDLESTPSDLRDRYVGRSHAVGALRLDFDDEVFYRAAAKYGGAVAHTARMNRYLANKIGETSYELEMSVDETETPTSIREHFFVASELQRLGVRCVSLAPRFVGRMEKGVDYIGDLAAFEASLIRHVEVARNLGPYKLSLHSGSDKFTLYPLFAEHAGGLFHLKTAGTSYLEALRAVSSVDPDLFREILAFSIDRYSADRATYHVSAELERVPPPEGLTDDDLPGLLDEFHARQVLHVTFGSVLTADHGTRFARRLKAALRRDEQIHYQTIERHFDRHLAPF